MKLAAGTVLLAAVVLAASACGSATTSGQRNSSTQRPASTPARIEASGLMQGGAIRCTASVASPVEAGQALDVTFTFHNISKRTQKVDLAYGGMWLVIRSPDGTKYDTRIPLENEFGPYVPPAPIAPGATKTVPLQYLRVRWEGPLRVTPGCAQTTLRPLHVVVTSPGLPASREAAVRSVVAASGHLFDHCRPQAAGASVVGRIEPPSGNAPPLQARCSISLRRERGFYLAQALIVSPSDLQGVRVQQPYETLTGLNTQGRNAEAIAWQFVVTRNAATSVNSNGNYTTESGRGMAPNWDWTGARWEGPGGSHCGGSGGGGGGIDGPNVAFVSVCGR